MFSKKTRVCFSLSFKKTKTNKQKRRLPSFFGAVFDHFHRIPIIFFSFEVQRTKRLRTLRARCRAWRAGSRRARSLRLLRRLLFLAAAAVVDWCVFDRNQPTSSSARAHELLPRPLPSPPSGHSASSGQRRTSRSGANSEGVSILKKTREFATFHHHRRRHCRRHRRRHHHRPRRRCRALPLATRRKQKEEEEKTSSCSPPTTRGPTSTTRPRLSTSPETMNPWSPSELSSPSRPRRRPSGSCRRRSA